MPRLPQTTLQLPRARRLLAIVGATVLALVVATFADMRTAGDVPDDIEVAVATSTSTAGSAGGGSGEPGPGAGDVAPTSSPPLPTVNGVRFPDLVLLFQSALALSDGGEAMLTYRAGVTARDGGEYALAAQLFAQVSAGSGALAPFARLREAQMLALDAQAVEAAAAFDAVIADLDALPVSVRPLALTEAANVYEVAGRVDDALAALSAVEALDVGSFTNAAAQAERARILRDIGDPGWVDLAGQAMLTQPESGAAVEALDMLMLDGQPYPEYTAAYVEYRARRNDAAEERYLALIDGGTLTAEEAATAWFYLGALAERSFSREAAITRYGFSLVIAPEGPMADDALYWRGRVYEELGLVAEAAVEYDRLVEGFFNSPFREESRLRAAVALGIAGNGADATARLASIVEIGTPSAAAEAARWHDILVEHFGAPPAGELSALSADPTSYASAFELSGDALVAPVPAFAVDERPQPIAADEASAQQWANGMFGIPSFVDNVLEAPDVLLAWELATAGEAGVARGLLGSECASRTLAQDRITLAFEAHRRGLHDVALNCTSYVLARLSPAEYLAAPPSLLALAYPVPYIEQATAAADEFGVPVLLMYALVRQESAFNPEAGSTAGAFGLTQVVLPTGEFIASALDLPAWSFADLAAPSVALRFGAYYLAEQLDDFDGHMLAALSAYNGGPGNAARWLSIQPFEGPDGYLYAVDFTETRLYLELVTANYAMYRYLYAGAEVPSLPHGG